MAVLFLDLDDFKKVNDTQGHEAGDSLLKEIARRLVDCIRQTDTAIRLSGDEFTVVLENLVNGLDDARGVADKLLSSISSPVQIGTNIANVGVSIGIAMHDGKQNITADALLKMADTVMYKAKHAGKSSIKWE
jgi:diguanylate cyclase (GGDEF)-like protein